MTKKLIRISEETKKELDDIKVHPRETYDDIVQRLLEKVSGRKWLRDLRGLESEEGRLLDGAVR